MNIIRGHDGKIWRRNGPGRCICPRCDALVSTNALGRAAHIKACPGKPGLIPFKWTRFAEDSYHRGVFRPEVDTQGVCHVTKEQLQSLLGDAEYYADPYGPDQCPPGLVNSAKATVAKCRAALAPGGSYLTSEMKRRSA